MKGCESCALCDGALMSHIVDIIDLHVYCNNILAHSSRVVAKYVCYNTFLFLFYFFLYFNFISFTYLNTFLMMEVKCFSKKCLFPPTKVLGLSGGPLWLALNFL